MKREGSEGRLTLTDGPLRQGGLGIIQKSSLTWWICEGIEQEQDNLNTLITLYNHQSILID